MKQGGGRQAAPGVRYSIVQMKKKMFVEFFSELLAEKHLLNHGWVPAFLKAMVRNVLLSKCCVSGQHFCSAAISSKSISGAAALVATTPADRDGKERRNKKLATTCYRPVR
jgi:hypothetical protein